MWPQEETMQHILTECTYPGQREVWALAKQLWEKKKGRWPHISLGLILGAGQVRFMEEDADENEPARPNAGTQRLFRILVSESAYLIWLLRVERVIKRDNNRLSTTQEIRNRWTAAINARLTLDRKMTNRAKYQGRAITPHVVKMTWKGVLKNEDDLPQGWEKGEKTGVLVSIELPG
jgi:hypothetical protein